MMKRKIGWLGSDSSLYTTFLPFGETGFPRSALLLVLQRCLCLCQSNLLPTGQQHRCLAHLATITWNQAYPLQVRRVNSLTCGGWMLSKGEGSTFPRDAQTSEDVGITANPVRVLLTLPRSEALLCLDDCCFGIVLS
jgi:hypothetical protein